MPLLLVAGGAVPLAVAAAALWVVATTPPTPDPDSLPSRVLEPPVAAYCDAIEEGRAIARALTADEKLPGVSLAVAVDGEIVWAEGFGRADLEDGAPVTPATRFRVGGISELVTAAAAGLLVERGRLDLDAPVQSYVPGFPPKEWPVTTRHLLAHSAGLRRHRGETGIFIGAACTDAADGVELFAGDPLRYRPGSRLEYSAYDGVLAGAAVAGAAGEPYLEFVRREILAPLGMEHTVPDRSGELDRAHFYYPRLMLKPRWGLQDAPEMDLSCYLAAVGFLSTPSDLVRFGSAMMGDTLLDPATIEMLQTPVRLESGEPSGQALGWTVGGATLGADDAVVRIAGRGLGAPVLYRPLSAVTVGGQVAGGTATLLVVPAFGVAVAVTSNVSGAENVSELALRVADAFAGTPGAR